MTILINFLLVIWIMVALFMALIILMQRPKSEGLGAAFGGGVTENIFGAQTTTVLTKATGWFAGVFFVLTFLLSVLYAHRGAGESALSRQLKQGAAAPAGSSTSPAAVVAPAPSGSAATQPVVPGAGPGASARPSDLAVGVVPPAAAAPVLSPSPAPSSPPPKRKK